MVQTGQKAREAAYAILQDIDLATYSKQFMKTIANFLEIEETKVYQKSAWADKIVQIYEAYRGQYDIFLTQQKFRHLNSECKDFLWTIFKQYDEKLSQRKYLQPMQTKPMMGREHAPQNMATPNQNMNMNMVNMFLEVPNFQTVEDIQIFQRKMFEVYKNVLPQVLNGIPMTTQSQFYRGNNPYQYGMGMGNMGGIPNMNGLGGIGGMAGMSAMSGMSGMPVGNMGGLSSMASMSYTGKTPEYYESSSSFPNRYYYDNKMPMNFNQAPINPKPMMSQYKSASQSQIPSMGFNYYGGADRYNSEEYRGAFKGVSPYAQQQQRPNNNEEFERKPIQSRFFGLDEQKYDTPYQVSNSHELISPLEKPSFKYVEKQKQREFYSACDLPAQHEPRKQVKRDDEVSIFNDNLQEKETTSSQVVCMCNNKQNVQKCLYCRIINIDPFNEAESTLIVERVNSDSPDVHVEINKKILDKINKNADKLDIEIRCIKANLECEHEISWPQKYILKIDEEIVEDFLQELTSKKRKDKPFIFSKIFGNEKNTQDLVEVILTTKKASSEKYEKADQFYIYGVFLVSKNSIDKMSDKLMKKAKQQNIFQFFKAKQKQSGEQIIVSPLEPTIKKLIKDPVRGKNCTHPQCFDLQIFLSFLIISPNRQWRCPICNKDAKQLVIDKEMKSVLSDISKMIKEPKEIVFYANGSHQLKYDQNQSQSDDTSKKENPNIKNSQI